MTDKTATLSIDRGEGKIDAIDLPVMEGSLGPNVVNVGALTANGYFTSTLASPRRLPVNPKSPSLTEKKAYCSTVDTLSINWLKNPTFLKCATCY